MVCAAEAQKDLRSALGATPTQVTTPTWADHVYSCAYVYPSGTMTLSVKELGNTDETKSYFDKLASTRGRRGQNMDIGDDAVATRDGSIVLRKDQKVLLIDVAKLPKRFGEPPFDRSQAAVAVAVTIMGCWTGK
jgi:hypothetical protein